MSLAGMRAGLWGSLVPLAFVLLAGCSGSSDDRVDGLAINRMDAGRRFDLVLGESAAIGLPADPADGEGWTITAYDPAVIQPDGELFSAFRTYTTDGSARGFQRFRLRAVGAGTSAVRLERSNPWAPGGEESFEVTLSVSERSSAGAS